MSQHKQSGGAYPQGSKGRNSASGPTKPGGKYVSYCPECPQNVPMPTLTNKASMSGGEKFGKCKEGHTWVVRW